MKQTKRPKTYLEWERHKCIKAYSTPFLICTIITIFASIEYEISITLALVACVLFSVIFGSVASMGISEYGYKEYLTHFKEKYNNSEND